MGLSPRGRPFLFLFSYWLVLGVYLVVDGADLLGNGEMFVMRTTESPAHPIRELIGTEQPVGFDDLSLAVYPLRLYGVQPRALLGQEGNLTILTPFACLSLTLRLCLPIQLSDLPGDVPTGVVQMRTNTFLPNARASPSSTEGIGSLWSSRASHPRI